MQHARAMVRTYDYLCIHQIDARTLENIEQDDETMDDWKTGPCGIDRAKDLADEMFVDIVQLLGRTPGLDRYS